MKKEMHRKTYIAIGYWYEDNRPELPDPAWFTDENYPESEKGKVIDYLKKGKDVNLYRGWSNCRICGEKTPGASDLTDGLFIFPSGLVHYIEKHNLRLPDEFIKRVDGKKSSLSEKYLDTNKVSKSFDWWSEQKGIDQSKSSKNNPKVQNRILGLLEDDFDIRMGNHPSQ